ncbi:hypothetical protein DM860_008289 [Cuscuta australis]|uniref:RRM domain-containing protein n=1 Tax=Cuscuta australis TaxID=267555 RepID=A0A328D724_9ASTE|nr:hypothetical protein DM860_008289 [Cuscuta australis]
MYPTVLTAVAAVATIARVVEQLGFLYKETPAEPEKAVEAAEKPPADICKWLNGISRFNGSGYEIWSSKMKTMFMYRDLWDLVEEGYTEEELTAEDFKYARKRDAAPLLLIMMSIDESIFSCIANSRTSKQAWDALEKKFKGKTRDPNCTKAEDESAYSCVVDATMGALDLEKHVNESVLSSPAACADETESKEATSKVVELNGFSKAFGEMNSFGSKEWCSGNSSGGFHRDENHSSKPDCNGKKCEVFRGYRLNSYCGGRGGRIGGRFDNYQGGSGGREGENVSKGGRHGGGPGGGDGLRFNKWGSHGGVDSEHVNNQWVHGGQDGQHFNKQGRGGDVDSEPSNNNMGFHGGGSHRGGYRGGRGYGFRGDGGCFGGFHGGGSEGGERGNGGCIGGFRGGHGGGFRRGGTRGGGGCGSGERKLLNNDGGFRGVNHKHFNKDRYYGGKKHKSFNEGSHEGIKHKSFSIKDGCFNPKNGHRGLDGQPFIGSKGGQASMRDEFFNNEHSVFGKYNSSKPKRESNSSFTTNEIKLKEQRNALEQPHEAIHEMQVVKLQDGMNSTPKHSHEEALDLKSGGSHILKKKPDDKTLRDVFSTLGNVLSCEVVRDGSGVSKWHGYIENESEEALQNAIEKMNGTMLNGKQVCVEYFISSASEERGMGVEKTILSPFN